MSQSSPDISTSVGCAQQPVTVAVWHSLFWLVFANAIGVLLSILLLVPSLNGLLGEWTYGRLIMVHMNLELYGWTSLPMVGFLFKVYGTERGPLSKWCRPVLWVWSAALGVGAYSWLSGHSSGKLFLDWSGTARVFFPLAMLALWLLLVVAFMFECKTETLSVRGAKIAGLMFLLVVPFVMYFASGPNYYPAINPDTGGPTGASQLESSLMIVAILLMLPFGLTQRKAGRAPIILSAWAIMMLEFILCFALGRGDMSHHRPAQFISLGSLLVWIPLTPAYYAAFKWNENTRRWRITFLAWWSALVLTGWVLFLPGILDYFKFTDALVGHSLLAMAGFTSSLLIFILVQLLGEDGWIFNRRRSFYGWNIAVAGYVVLMTIAGWREGSDPTFTILSGPARNAIYIFRFVVGAVMLAASIDWLIDATMLQNKHSSISVVQEVAA
jgi:cytochrome c oxidase cbb3-type subunit 1